MELKIVEKAKIWFAISLVIILAGLAVFAINGLNLGVDFSGGSLIQVNIGKVYDVEEIRSTISDLGVNATVSYSGEDNQDAIIRTGDTTRTGDIQNALAEKFDLSKDQFTIETVGATMGAELTRNALTSILLACLIILVYVWFRFELKSGVAAIIALVHDVLIMFSVVTLLKVQVNSTFVAALLTIIGYSINDTIVVFDRVRENRRRNSKSKMGALVNKSIADSIVRCMNTSLTTLFAVAALYIFGVESVKEFALPLLVGIIAGTYSSIFIAGPIWAMWVDHEERKKLPAAK